MGLQTVFSAHIFTYKQGNSKLCAQSLRDYYFYLDKGEIIFNVRQRHLHL